MEARKPPPTVSTAMTVIEPFLVSGGQSYYRYFGTVALEAVERAGTQLVTSVYIPKGKIGFLKQVRVAPFMPTLFSDPWITSGAAAAGASWRDFNSADDTGSPAPRDDELPFRPGGQNGVWTTPFGWENYAPWTPDPHDGVGYIPNPPALIPYWAWSIRFIQGDILLLRSSSVNLPPEPPAPSPGGEGTETGAYLINNRLVLTPDLAVPAQVYPNGLPGIAPGPAWGANRVQALQSDPANVHAMIPEDTTCCLFTQWRQRAYLSVAGRDVNGRIIYSPAAESIDPGNNPWSIYPLLPSFGVLGGYMQSRSSPAALYNAEKGWGG